MPLPALPPAPPVVAVTTSEYAFRMPDTLPAGVVTLHVVNAGAQAHQMALYAIAPGTAEGEVVQTLIANKRRPDGVTKIGGIEDVEPRGRGPGSEASVTLELRPGRYVAVCGYPGPNGQTHNALGMIHVFTVAARPGAPGAAAAAAAAATLPSGDVTVALTEYDFTLSRPLTAGRHLLRVENRGTQAHHLNIARLKPGKTRADADAWNGTGDPPFVALGGAAAMDPGQVNVVPADFRPGTYLFVCLLADKTDGKPHFMHGMEREIRVR